MLFLLVINFLYILTIISAYQVQINNYIQRKEFLNGVSRNKIKLSNSVDKELKISYDSSELSLFDKYKMKVLAWGSLGAFGFVLQPFLPILICTFYFSVVGNSIVDIFQTSYLKILHLLDRYFHKVVEKIKNIPRKAFATIYAMLLIASISRFGFYLFPIVLKESQYVFNVVKSEDPYKLLISIISKTIGFETISRAENILTKIADNEALKFAGYIGSTSNIRIQEFSQNTVTLRFGKLLQYYMTGYLNKTITITRRIISNSTSAFINAILGLFFSLMVVWDLPQLQNDIQQLNYSRIGPIYKELSPKLSAFGKILASSFEAQFLIALVNCTLTTAGLIALKIPGILFFSLLTLLSSFIPIAGIFIATIPPFIVALTDFGLLKGLELIAMVVIVHAIESYLLYPQIYSHKLKLHPLLVLSSLYIAEHFAGIPGLFLALPVTLFVMNQILFDGNSIMKQKDLLNNQNDSNIINDKILKA